MTLRPAEADSGIRFRRLDVPGSAPIVATYEHVSDTLLCTTVASDEGVKVATIEHLMAAFAGCGVDNVLVELDGPEVPAMDGSAAPFVFLLECADLVEQDVPRRWIRVLKPVHVHDGDRSASLAPADGFLLSFQIEFDSPAVARQSHFVDLRNGAFKTDLCRARTFGFANDVDRLRALGLARGGSLDNAVVVAGDRVLNDDGLRYDNEFVRHKLLDSIGDLYLAGGPLLARFSGDRSGHALNNMLLKKLFADKFAWCHTDTPPGTMLPAWDWGARAATA